MDEIYSLGLRSQFVTLNKSGNLRVIYNNSFHDRYFILDNSIIYHCGTSLNYIGKKTFSINKIEDEFVIKCLIDKVRNLE